MKKRPASGTFRSFFESKFKPPKNASIARFQGLCCYQSRSEKSAFHACAARLAAGFQNVAVSERLKLRPGWAAS